ncbi:hypothetical protein QFC21_001254 [Naganishia friedmannii]|uniref:Uncharacterized protein n=1 Tax=Naganishia friedmannii TaxID=89922 RepID=A0ACC2W673_9TREE|nr:hypothetical protein QFC21_001254 [Naganishia friedmannii]
MTAVAPSPLPFTNVNSRLVNDSPRSSHRHQQRNSSFRQHGGLAAAASPRNVNSLASTAGANSTNALDGYGDGIKALLADPIKFEPYAKKVVVDEAKYKPINGQMEALDHASAVAGPSRQPFSYAAGGEVAAPTPSSHASQTNGTDLWPRPVKTSWPNDPVYERHTKGLQNLGNTCFANSIMQVMMYTPPVLHYLSGDGHNFASCPLSSKGFCLTCELHKARRNLWTPNGSSWAPKDIMRSIKKICPTMRQYRQEDAHEFFRYGIDLLHNEALKVAKATDTFDAFLDLSLDVDRNIDSVKDALAKFVQKDTLKGKNKYKCEKCKKLVDATKQMLIVKAPEVLSLHLKRFTPTGRKITSTIKYTANLNLDHYMDSESPSPSYELYAVTVHQGSGPHIGHYYSFVKNKNGKWFEANDESVNISQAKIYASAYILHYIRKPGSALDAIKAGKQSQIYTPRKGPSENGRIDRNGSQAATPNTESTPIKRGEKRKHGSEDGASDEDEAERQSEKGPTPAKSKSNAPSAPDGHASPDEEPHARKKNRAQDRPFAPVPAQQFGYGTSSVSQALKSAHGDDRVFEARSQGYGHKNGGKNRGGKVHSSPYNTAGGMDSKRPKKKMKGRDFKKSSFQ